MTIGEVVLVVVKYGMMVSLKYTGSFQVRSTSCLLTVMVQVNCCDAKCSGVSSCWMVRMAVPAL